MSGSLHLFHVFPGFGCGGTQLRTVRIVNGMGGAARHTILALDGATDAATRIAPGIRFEVVPQPPAGGWQPLALKLRRLIGERRPDLLLTYNWGAIDAVLGASLPPLCPIVHNECGFGPDEAVRLRTRRVLARHILLGGVAATVVTSRHLLEICRDQYKLPPARTRWIRTGIDTEVFRPDLPRTWRDEIGAAPGEFLIGFLGALRSEKNLELLLSGFAQARLHTARLALIGDGPCRPALERLAGEMGIRSRVIFAGASDTPAACLAACDLFAMSSSTEQTSNALLEAMAAGLPVVATDVGDCREVAGPEGGIAVPSGDIAAYAAALRTAAGAATWRLRAAAANRRRAIENYSNDRMVREYQALYTTAAAGRETL